MANKLPKYLSEIIPYSRLVRKKNGFRQSVSSYMERSKILIGDAYDVDYDRVVDIFLRAWDKSEKDYPSPSVITPQNIAEFSTFNEYCLYLWEYYVEDKKQPPKPKAPPKVPEQKKPEPPKEQEPPQVTSEGDFEGYGDEDDFLSTVGTEKPKKQTTAISLYEGVKEEDLIGDEEIDERILRMLGLDVIEDIDYATYISLLKEWSAAARMTGAKISTEEAELITNEFRRVKRKVGRFRIKKQKVNISDPQAPSPVQSAKNFITGAAVPEQKLLPPAEGPKKKRKKRKASLEENVAAIRKNVEAIQKILEDSLKQKMKAIGAERRSIERTRRDNRENKLEGAIKKTMSVARKMLTPVFDVLGRIIDFLKAIILGRIMYQLVDWLGKEENQKKLNSVIQFIKDWWPALLAGFLLFATPLGALVRTVFGTITKLTLLMLRKGIPMLLRFVAKNPVASAALAIVGGAAIGGIMQSQTESNDPERAAQGKTQLDDTMEFGGVTGDPMGALRFTGGGQIPAYTKGGYLPKKTKPSGGKITASTGKRVKGGGKDTQMIIAQPGEIVISKKAVDKFGAPFFLDLNKAGGGTNIPKFMSGIQLAQEGGQIGMSLDNIPTIDVTGIQQAQYDEFGLDKRAEEVGARQALREFRIWKLEKLMDTTAPTVQRNSGYAELPRDLYIPPSPSTSSSNRSGSNLGSNFSGMRSSAVIDVPMYQETDVEPMAEPKTIPATGPNATPLTGIIPQDNKTQAPKATPVPIQPITKTVAPPPPPPAEQVDITTISTRQDQKGNLATNAGNDRDIPEFETSIPTASRMMNIQIYGLIGVE